jgi:hypothetical protein
MKHARARIILALLVCLCLFVAACSPGGTSAASGTPVGTSATTAQPTKPKPTALPQMTIAFCQSILTVSEANQIMKAPHTATAIRIDAPPSGGGSCNYEYASYKAIVSMVFVNVIPAGTTFTADAIAAHIQQSASGVQGAKITTQPVSGVGDAAVFAAGSATLAGQPYKFDALDIAYGRVFFDVNIALLGPDAASASDSVLLASFTQIAQLVTSRW